MPRYFFHSSGSSREPDTEGTELANDRLAHQAAVAFAGETLKDDPSRLLSHGPRRVEVTDANDNLLLTVLTLAVAAPRPSVRRAILRKRRFHPAVRPVSESGA